MGYHFRQDLVGLPVAQFSIGHEAVVLWLTDELGKDLRVESLLQLVTSMEQGQLGFRDIIGLSMKLTLDITGIELEPLEDDYSTQDLDEQLMDETELLSLDDRHAQCGLTDFKQALLSWQLFITS